MQKVVRDGRVAVLYSPGWGAGWYTWNQDHPECLFDPDVVAWVEQGKQDSCPDLEAKYDWNGFYDGGAQDLAIKWIPQGVQFRIDEYDGSESVILAQDEVWMTA